MLIGILNDTGMSLEHSGMARQAIDLCLNHTAMSLEHSGTARQAIELRSGHSVTVRKGTSRNRKKLFYTSVNTPKSARIPYTVAVIMLQRGYSTGYSH